jgi:hypothetical protein
MKTLDRLRKLSVVAIGLRVVHGLALVAATTDAIEPIARVADVAREKDVVWLSLVTAIVALIFSAWLVRQMMHQTTATIAAINALSQKLRGRPCFYREAELERQRHHPSP